MGSPLQNSSGTEVLHLLDTAGSLIQSSILQPFPFHHPSYVCHTWSSVLTSFQPQFLSLARDSVASFPGRVGGERG